MKSGSNIPTLNRNDLYPVTVLFEDDYEKQEEIANILDSIDAQINRNNKMVHKLQYFKQVLSFSIIGGIQYAC
jgi:type I restriction enzyme S subunit